MSLTAFISYLTYEKNYSPNTVKAYSRDLRKLQQWLDDHEITRQPTTILPADLKEFNNTKEFCYRTRSP